MDIFNADHNGPFIEKKYAVKTVESHPTHILWELGESLALDLPGEMSITDAQCYETTSGTTLTGTVQANAGDIVIATIARRSTLTIPLGWVKLYESTETLSANQTMVIATKKVDTIGLVSYTATQATSGRLYLNLISVSGIDDIVFAPELESIYRSGVKPAPMPDKQEGEKIIWGATVSLYATSSPYGGWSTTPDDLTIIHLDQAITAPRLANLIDFGDGQANNRTIMQSPSTTGEDVNIAGLKVIQNYTTPKIYTSQAIQLDGEYRLRWIENKPSNTDIIIEYTTGETQGQWQEVDNGDVVNADTNLWIRATLSTEDTTITPILQNLWLEETSAPQDKILITMLDEFKNVQGDIIVKYNQALGHLTGKGGAIVNFEEQFRPTELEEGLTRTGGAVGIHEYIQVGIGGSVELIEIEKIPIYSEIEHIEVGIGGSIELIHVDDLNP